MLFVARPSILITALSSLLLPSLGSTSAAAGGNRKERKRGAFALPAALRFICCFLGERGLWLLISLEKDTEFGESTENHITGAAAMWMLRTSMQALALMIVLHSVAASPQWPGGSQPWSDVPACTSGPDPTSTASPSSAGAGGDEYSHLYNLTRMFFDNMMVPNNLPQLKDLASPLFAENITGRVSDSRKFLGRELNTEYVFGAFTGPIINPARVTLLGMPTTHSTMRFAANVADRSAFITEVVNFNITLLGKLVPVQLDLWMRWNSADEVSAYDARFVYFDWLMADATESLSLKYGLESLADTQNRIKEVLVQQVCQTTLQHCQGDLEVYASMDECHDFLMQKVPLGQPYEFGRDTVMCRSLHEGMLVLKPEAHCAHVGPTGGDMCTNNLDYGQYVTDKDFFANVGHGQ